MYIFLLKCLFIDYLPSTKEEWKDFVDMYSKFLACHSTNCRIYRPKARSEVLDSSTDSSAADDHYGDGDHGNSDVTPTNQSDSAFDATPSDQSDYMLDVEPCPGHCIRWSDVADLLMRNLDGTTCIEILQQFDVQDGFLTSDFYQRALVSSMIEKQQRYSGFSSIRAFSSTRAPPKTQIAPILVRQFFNMPWLTSFWIKYNRKYEKKWEFHKISWENVNYFN